MSHTSSETETTQKPYHKYRGRDRSNNSSSTTATNGEKTIRFPLMLKVSDLRGPSRLQLHMTVAFFRDITKQDKENILQLVSKYTGQAFSVTVTGPLGASGTGKSVAVTMSPDIMSQVHDDLKNNGYTQENGYKWDARAPHIEVGRPLFTEDEKVILLNWKLNEPQNLIVEWM